MAANNGNRNNSEYVASASSTQDAQPSPLAMLAATCSKIGSPAQTTEEGYGQGGDTNVRVVGAGQGGTTGNVSDAISGWFQLPNGTIVDSTGKPINTGNVLQQAATALTNNVGNQLFAQGQQIIATPGPNGQLTYSVVPSFQTLNIDGQDAFLIPSSGGVGGQQAQVTAANVQQNAQQQALITPNGQIIRAQGLQAASGTTNLFQNVAGFGGLGNFVNIGGNLVSLGGVQNSIRPNNNLMQSVQIPGFQALQQMPNIIQVPVSINGQTVLQTIQLPAQNLPIQTSLQQVSNNGIMAFGTNQQQNLQTLLTTQGQATVAVNQQEDNNNAAIQPQNLKIEGKQNLNQTVSSASTAGTQQTKVSTMGMTTPVAAASVASPMQAVNVINTPQGQMIFTPTSNQSQLSQSLPTLTVPSYPQTITANASSGTSTTTTTASAQNAMLQNVLAQQQLLQGLAAGGQNLGGLQLTNQSQLNWLQQALNLQNPRTSGVQTLQVQNLQGLQNLQTFGAALQGLQGIQAFTPQGQLINGASLPNLGGAVAIGTPGGGISALPLNQAGVQAGGAVLGGQGILATAQLQQDPLDPTKWQIVNQPTGATIAAAATQNTANSVGGASAGQSSSTESTPTSSRRLRRVACTCPNCTATEKVVGENKKKQHICHIQGCGKVYGKTSHLRAHLRWHSGDRPFMCTWLFCGKRFTRSDELQRHKRTHTGEKKFQCPECNKRFMRSDHLSKHLRTHNTKRQILGDAVSSTQGLDLECEGEDGMEEDDEDDSENKGLQVQFDGTMSEDEEDGVDGTENVKLEALAS